MRKFFNFLLNKSSGTFSFVRRILKFRRKYFLEFWISWIFFRVFGTSSSEKALYPTKPTKNGSTHVLTYCDLYWNGTAMLNWDSRYLCHFSTEMAEIWSPGTPFKDVWTCKISALYLLYFHTYESFCGVFTDFH